MLVKERFPKAVDKFLTSKTAIQSSYLLFFLFKWKILSISFQLHTKRKKKTKKKENLKRKVWSYSYCGFYSLVRHRLTVSSLCPNLDDHELIFKNCIMIIFLRIECEKNNFLIEGNKILKTLKLLPVYFLEMYQFFPWQFWDCFSQQWGYYFRK